MKKLMFGVAAVVAAIALPGVAQAETKATLGAGFGNWDPGSASDDVDVWSLDGAFSNDFSNGWTLQADGAHERISAGGSDLGQSFGNVAFGKHNESFAVYGFAGLSDFVALSGVNYGAGGQVFLPNMVFDGSVGQTDFDSGDLKVTNVNLDGAYFLTDNFAIRGQVGHTEIDNGGTDGDWNTYGVSAEYRLASSPVSFSVGYQNRDFDGGDIDAWKVGLTFDLGSGSLHERATTGPGWNGGRALHEEALAALF